MRRITIVPLVWLAMVALPSCTVTQHNRSTPMGNFVDVPFDATDFTADTGTWTVAASPDYERFDYSLVGKTMHISFIVDVTSVSATPGSLIVEIPGGFVAATANTWPIIYSDNGGTLNVGRAFTNPGDTKIRFVKFSGTWSTSTDLTYMAFNGTLRIQ